LWNPRKVDNCMRQENTQIQIRRYLLGDLGEEQQQLEARLMTEDDVFTELLVLEDELTEEYLAGSLSVKEREAFERHFLSASERQQGLKFSLALRRHIARVQAASSRPVRPGLSQSPPAKPRLQRAATRYAFKVMGLAALAAGLWMILAIVLLRREIASLRTDQNARQSKEQHLQQQLNDLAGHSQELQRQLAQMAVRQGQVAGTVSSWLESITLTPGLVRDFGTFKRLVLSATTSLVQLKLELSGDRRERYRVVILDAEGSEVCRLSRLKDQAAGASRIVVVTLPAELLPRGDYSLKLSGSNAAGDFEDIDNYSLRVLRRQEVEAAR
jgi:uncharacterized protein YhaN